MWAGQRIIARSWRMYSALRVARRYARAREAIQECWSARSEAGPEGKDHAWSTQEGEAWKPGPFQLGQLHAILHRLGAQVFVTNTVPR